ncbi:MAG: hypothetical protein K5873_08930 [Treponema sp.]|nr:hypothetical protein [Treponema sp.]
MKKTKHFLLLTGITFSLLFGITACSDDNGEESTASGPETTEVTLAVDDYQESPDEQVFNLLRGLCQLPTDEEATNSEDEGNGIEELPENWQNYEYELDSSLVADPETEGVYYIASTGLDDAKEFVSSLLGGEEIKEQTYTHYLGSLKFTANNTSDLYATLDLNISLLPKLPKLNTIKFVPLEKCPNYENKYSGPSYYSVGDIIKRNKDSTYWMCVRPSSGPARKDYSYWICLNPSKIVKTTTKSYKVKSGKSTETKKGTFAKSLMSEKIAKATIRTLNLLTIKWAPGAYISGPGEELAKKGTVLTNLAAFYKEGVEDNSLMKIFEKKDSSDNGMLNRNKFKYMTYCVAYGSYKKDSNRKTGFAEFNLVQPVMTCDISIRTNAGDLAENIDTTNVFHYVSDDDIEYITTGAQYKHEMEGKPAYISLTDIYDSTFMKKWGARGKLVKDAFDVKKYYQTYDDSGKIGWASKMTLWDEKEDGSEGYHVIVSPELKLKDNKNRAVTGYTEIYRTDWGDEKNDHYWESFKNVARTVNGEVVDNDKEISQ